MPQPYAIHSVKNVTALISDAIAASRRDNATLQRHSGRLPSPKHALPRQSKFPCSKIPPPALKRPAEHQPENRRAYSPEELTHE
jgi:hypothetical protein